MIINFIVNKMSTDYFKMNWKLWAGTWTCWKLSLNECHFLLDFCLDIEKWSLFRWMDSLMIVNCKVFLWIHFRRYKAVMTNLFCIKAYLNSNPRLKSHASYGSRHLKKINSTLLCHGTLVGHHWSNVIWQQFRNHLKIK